MQVRLGTLDIPEDSTVEVELMDWLAESASATIAAQVLPLLILRRADKRLKCWNWRKKHRANILQSRNYRINSIPLSKPNKTMKENF